MSLALDSDPSELQRLADALAEFSDQQNLEPDIAFKINLVLEELIMNIIAHGRVATGSAIEVTVTSNEDTISVKISDSGIAFDPLNDAPEAEITGSVQQRHVGGLGIHLVKTMMDEISYQREQNKNLLTMSTKKG